MNLYRVLYTFQGSDVNDANVVASTSDNAWAAVSATYAAGTVTLVEATILKTGVIVGS